MKKLFEKMEIHGMVLSNRFVRSATWEGMATAQGAATPRLIETLAALARGGVGLIITSHAYVRAEGKAGLRQIGIYKDELVNGLRELTAAVHEADGKIVLQISHAGTFAPEYLTGQTPMAPSVFEGLADSPRHEMSRRDIETVVEAFAQAAARARSAYFDGIQLHSAHGYLLNQFLSPLYNRRQDAYGGKIAQRARIHLEILRAVRTAVGKDFPILVKLNCRDFVEGGLTLKDSLQVGRMLADAGLNAVELSGGLPFGGKLSPIRTGIDSEEKEAYFREEAKAFKKEVPLPLILVGGIRSLRVAERLLKEGVADFFSLSRPLIREPDLINRWKSGDRRKALCKSDSLCFKPGMKGEGVRCVVKDRGRRL